MLAKIKRSGLGRKLLLAGTSLLSAVNRILPKCEDKILLYEAGRTQLEDNTEAFYRWLVKEGYAATHRITCCVPNDSHEGHGGYRPVGAFRGVLEYLTSKYVFFAFGDFRIAPSKEQVVVNLWHGTPVKTIGKMTGYRRYAAERLDSFSWICATSENIAPIMAKAFDCSLDKVRIVGQPRTDYFFSSSPNALEKLGIDRDRYRKVVLWMPTFRASRQEGFSDGDTDVSEVPLPIVKTNEQLEELNRAAEGLGILILIKPHPVADIDCKSLSSIKCLWNRDIDAAGIALYEFVRDCDALITDYSSIYCDYLLLDRPMCFTVDDLDKYLSTRGFSFENVTDLMPGPHVSDLDGLIAFLHELDSGIDRYSEDRQRANGFFNSGVTRNNCAVLASLCGLSSSASGTASEPRETRKEIE